MGVCLVVGHWDGLRGVEETEEEGVCGREERWDISKGREENHQAP